MNASIESLSQNNLCQVSTRELVIGMFIAELDCAWSATPFPPGGFHLKKADDIATLNKFCRTVQIDLNKGTGPKLLKQKQLTILSSARKASPQAVDLKVKRDAYPVSQTLKQLIDSSAAAYQELSLQFTELTGRVRAGHDLRLTDLDSSLDACLDSIIANPQTMVWLLNTDSFPVAGGRYCVRAAVWATMLARQFGLPRKELRALMLGTLLCDIGLYLLPERLVNKRGFFRKKEFLAYRKHVEFGLELLNQQSGLDDRVPRIVRCHHERNDGLGFPRGLKGEQIPALARFAHLAYCCERYLRTAAADRFMSPATAISRLYKQRDLKFPEQLIVEFIHLLGMYPLGSLVTLSTEETAVVLEQHGAERMNPKVAVLLDAQGIAVDKPRIIDLSAEAADCTISNSQPPGYRNLNAEQYRLAFFGKRVALGPLSFRF
jgi:HD-GYP domain-containing protein (c-di-GMP phosphodiesterase class II)